MPDDAGERALHLPEGAHAAAARAAGQKAREQLVQLDLMGRDLVLDEVADDREQQDDEREGGEEQVEGERACQKGNVVLEGRLQRAPHDAGDRPMPAALVPHASGSSSSSAVAPPRRAAPIACPRPPPARPPRPPPPGQRRQPPADPPPARAVRAPLALAHSPASRSSGAATATARGAACDCSGGLTWRSTTARVSATRSCSNRNANVRSRSAPIAPRTSSGRSHSRRLNGPIAFLRLL